MRAVIQRVTRASVAVNGGEPRPIGPGLVILLGVRDTDDIAIVPKLAEKCAHLRIFEAEELIDKQVCNLSGGQLQRVLLALAVMDEPNLLLLDEPVSGIDQNGMELFFKTMDYLKKHYDLAIILISHDLDYVARYADHVVLLDKTVLRQGTVKEVYESSEFERIFSAGKEETWIKEDETND